MNAVAVKTEITGILRKWVEQNDVNLPMVVAAGLTPLLPKLGELRIIHPTTNDPVLISSKFGAIAIWFKI